MALKGKTVDDFQKMIDDNSKERDSTLASSRAVFFHNHPKATEEDFASSKLYKRVIEMFSRDEKALQEQLKACRTKKPKVQKKPAPRKPATKGRKKTTAVKSKSKSKSKSKRSTKTGRKKQTRKTAKPAPVIATEHDQGTKQEAGDDEVTRETAAGNVDITKEEDVSDGGREKEDAREKERPGTLKNKDDSTVHDGSRETVKKETIEKEKENPDTTKVKAVDGSEDGEVRKETAEKKEDQDMAKVTKAKVESDEKLEKDALDKSEDVDEAKAKDGSRDQGLGAEKKPNALPDRKRRVRASGGAQDSPREKKQQKITETTNKKEIYRGHPDNTPGKKQTVGGGWPKGWELSIMERKGGTTKGSKDSCYYSPGGKRRFTSLVNVRKFLKALEIEGSEEEAWKAYKTVQL